MYFSKQTIRFLKLCFGFQKKVQPWKLYSMVSGLLVLDLVILLVWQLQDPLQRHIEPFSLEDPVSLADDSKIRPELEHCASHHNTVWLGIVYGYKGLVLVSTNCAKYTSKIINNFSYLGLWFISCIRNSLT